MRFNSISVYACIPSGLGIFQCSPFCAVMDEVVGRSEQEPEGAIGNTSSACPVQFFVCNEMKAVVSDQSFKYLSILFVLVLEGRRQAFGSFQTIFDLIQTKQANALEKRSRITLIYLVSDLPENKVF